MCCLIPARKSLFQFTIITRLFGLWQMIFVISARFGACQTMGSFSGLCRRSPIMALKPRPVGLQELISQIYDRIPVTMMQRFAGIDVCLAAVVGGSRHGHAVRIHAAFKLAKLKPGEVAEAVPALMVLLQYPHINWRTHFAAVDALRAVGDAAIPSLVNGLHRGSMQVRKYAAIALKEIGKSAELLLLIDEGIRKAGLSGDSETMESVGRSAEE
jgi:hypothetical protein